MRSRPADPEYLKLLLRYDEKVQKLVWAVPKTNPRRGSGRQSVHLRGVHHSRSPSGQVAPSSSQQRMKKLSEPGLNFGKLLPDPVGLLRGESKWIRHIRIAQKADLQTFGVQELIRAAFAGAERSKDKAVKPRTVVRFSNERAALSQ